MGGSAPAQRVAHRDCFPPISCGSANVVTRNHRTNSGTRLSAKSQEFILLRLRLEFWCHRPAASPFWGRLKRHHALQRRRAMPLDAPAAPDRILMSTLGWIRTCLWSENPRWGPVHGIAFSAGPGDRYTATLSVGGQIFGRSMRSPVVGVSICIAFPLVLATLAVLTSDEANPQAGSDREASLAAWDRVASVLQHPRCLNCHQPNEPLQGDARRPHSPRVVRGRDNQGIAGMRCGSCHSERGNNEASRVPGASRLEDATAIHDLGRTVDRPALPHTQGSAEERRDEPCTRHRQAHAGGLAGTLVLGPGRHPRIHLDAAPRVRGVRRGMAAHRGALPQPKPRSRCPKNRDRRAVMKLNVNGREHDLTGIDPRHAAAMGVARQAQSDGHQVRLRARTVRGVHSSYQW